MAELFWPDVGYPTRAGRLRWLLAKLRAIGIPFENGAAELFFRTEDVRIDIDDIGNMQAGVIGAVLPGYNPSMSPRFAKWLEDQRSMISATIVRTLLTQLRTAVTRGDWSEVDTVAQAIQRVDELSEEAALALAESQCRAGARGAATAGLERYLSLLGDDASEARLQARCFSSEFGALVRGLGRRNRDSSVECRSCDGLTKCCAMPGRGSVAR